MLMLLFLLTPIALEADLATRRKKSMRVMPRCL